MGIMPDRAFKEMEKNIYEGVDLLNFPIVFLWTILCLLFISRVTSIWHSIVYGGVYYALLVVLCLVLFKDTRKYWSFPEENKKMPVFIGHKLDIILVYPILLMSIIGLISNSLMISGFFSVDFQQTAAVESKTIELILRIMLLPLVAFAEEFLNLLTVSFLYKKIKLLGKFRFIGSIFSAAFVFGILHSFGWGLDGAILVCISYIPVFFVTLYTGNIWISFLAHLYNDLISFTKAYYGSYNFVIIAAISLMPAVWAVRSIFKKTY